MKKNLIFLVYLLLCSFIFALSGNKTEIVKSGHWIYDQLYDICSENKKAAFLDNQPMTIGEMKFYFNEINYEELSQAGKIRYERIKEFLSSNKSFLKESDLRFDLNFILTPELYYQSNGNIPFSFDYAMKDRALTIPVVVGFSDYISMQCEAFVGKNLGLSRDPLNFSNVPYQFNSFDMRFPRFATMSTGMTFDKWGFNFHVGKEGLCIGKTALGSIILNDTFETDWYAQLNLFTDIFKYSCNIIEVQRDKYIYLHQLNYRPFKNVKFCCLEGSLLNAPFELRYLNPFTIMHSFASWFDFPKTPAEQKYYRESNFAAYLCFLLEYMPVSNLRLYGLYAQNEILDLGWAHSDEDLSYPDSLGGQIGVEYNIPLANDAFIKTNLEAVYTSPYLYVKQSPEWSLFRNRNEQVSGVNLNSWIGSPFGPDCFAVQLYSRYELKDKWNVSLGYLFKIHGENRAETMFTKKDVGGGEEIYYYYPYAQYMGAETDEERKAAVAKSRNMWMSGVQEFTNQIAVKAEYSVFSNLSVFGQVVYTVVYNSKNIPEAVNQGVELGIGCQYKIFK